MKFCDKLVNRRKENNLSQEQLAYRLGVSRQAVSKWESGSSIPDMAKILELCKILNCNLEDLVDDGVSSNKDVVNSKIDINNYFKEFLDFITRTLNMFWSMTLGEKVKCICEMLFIVLIFFIIWGIIGNIISSIFYRILSILPNVIYNVITGTCSIIYGLFGFIAGIIIIIHIFKIRYLDYFITIEDNNTNNKSVELPVDNQFKNDNEEIKFTYKKKNKIIIRDPKHSTYTFFEFLGRSIIWGIKFIIILLAIPCIFSFIGLFFGITFTIFLIKNGIFFLGIAILLLGCILINYLVLRAIYNFILNIKFNLKLFFIAFMVGLALAGIGSGISFCDYLTFDKITLTNKDIKYTTKEFNIDMKDNLILDFLNHDKTEIIYDEAQENIKVEVTYCKNGDVYLYDSIEEDYNSYEYIEYLDYDINYHQNFENDFFEEINYLVKQIKNKERIYNDYQSISNIKITTSHSNMERIQSNYNKLYN